MESPIEAHAPPAHEVLWPDSRATPLVFNSPHSGSYYPESFLAESRLDHKAIRRSEDALVDELFIGALDAGAPLLRVNFPRAWLDVNREPYELDPQMFCGRLPPYANVSSMRVAGGLGTIARIVSEAEEIYGQPIDVDRALLRIERFYKPYHALLESLLTETTETFGVAVLVDCHSMPSTVRGASSRGRPDIILGDRYGTSCCRELTEFASRFLSGLGYAVSRNKPYAGGFITENYGQPQLGCHALQVEVNRALYMNERSLEANEGFERLQADLSLFADSLAAFVDTDMLVRREAAE